jgi:asparagine synthase (glutamine-hydrolysing)
MCGICGVVALDGPLDPEIRSSVGAMAAALRHRGPDGDGFFSDEYASLGHRRLAIIDREGGAQPLCNEDGQCWIVFNGEIYNHQELRRDLQSRGHRFRTVSDTEAIIHAYEEYGPDCVDRLEGMFAFAIYDRARRELLLARDRVGKKPLFYAVLGGTLHFASEIKALRESPAWDPTIDVSQLEGYLSLGYILAPHTIFRHVKKLEPGHWLRVRGGQVQIREYWDIRDFDVDRRPEAQLVADLESTLSATVRERLESEVPLGAFLSGGIDSGLVVSMMSDHLRDEVITTSVGFDEAAHNELQAARLTATHFRTQHHESVLRPRPDVILDRILDTFDEPFADSSAVPTYYVSHHARQHVTVALSGDGGDEVFGGYDFRYVPHAVECAARGTLAAVGASRAMRAMGARWPRSPRLPRILRVGTLLENVGRSAADAYYADLCVMKPFDARRALGRPPNRDPRESPVYAAVTAPYLRCPSLSPIQRAQYADFKVYLPNDVLVKVDRMSMLNSLEVRCPLLDRRIVELGFRIPTRLKMPRLRAKHLLKEVASHRLPAQVLQLPKHGFSAPVGAWIRGPFAEPFAADVLAADSGVRDWLDRDVVARWVDEHRRGAQDRGHALWAIWMLGRWHRAHRSGPRTPALTKLAYAGCTAGLS